MRRPSCRRPVRVSRRNRYPLLRRWIDQGASWPERRRAAPRHRQKTATDHWAFMPRARSSPPQVKNKAWVRNPIDAFVLAKLEAQRMAPSPPAEPYHLLRRFHLDLTGLPPSIANRIHFSRIRRPKRSTRSSTTCWREKRTANAGRDTGSMWSVCRDEWIRTRCNQAARLALSRLCDPIVQ